MNPIAGTSFDPETGFVMTLIAWLSTMGLMAMILRDIRKGDSDTRQTLGQQFVSGAAVSRRPRRTIQ